MKKTIALLILTVFLWPKIYCQTDSICYTSEENTDIFLALSAYQDLKASHIALKSLYSDCQSEISEQDEIIRKLEKQIISDSLRYQKLRSEISKAARNKRDWENSRTKITELISE